MGVGLKLPWSRGVFSNPESILYIYGEYVCVLLFWGGGGGCLKLLCKIFIKFDKSIV